MPVKEFPQTDSSWFGDRQLEQARAVLAELATKVPETPKKALSEPARPLSVDFKSGGGKSVNIWTENESYIGWTLLSYNYDVCKITVKHRRPIFVQEINWDDIKCIHIAQ